MAHRSGQPARDLFPGHGAGKGDADRSPKWRDNYDEINWKVVVSFDLACDAGDKTETFVQVGPGRKKKTYK